MFSLVGTADGVSLSVTANFMYVVSLLSELLTQEGIASFMAVADFHLHGYFLIYLHSAH